MIVKHIKTYIDEATDSKSIEYLFDEIPYSPLNWIFQIEIFDEVEDGFVKDRTVLLIELINPRRVIARWAIPQKFSPTNWSDSEIDLLYDALNDIVEKYNQPYWIRSDILEPLVFLQYISCPSSKNLNEFMRVAPQLFFV